MNLASMRGRSWAGSGAIYVSLGLCFTPQARAAEYGLGAYLLGLEVPLGGVTPPPGAYFKNSFLLYDGSRQKDADTRLKYDFVVDVGTVAWFPDFTVFGAAPGVAATIPFVGDRTSIAETFTDPSGATQRTSFAKSASGLGDSEFTAILGWHAGEQHWNVSVTGFTPTGMKDPQGIAATGLNRPALDFRGAYTFLSGATGIEVTGIAGVTLNGPNTFTNYQSGAEFHFEWALQQHFASGLAAGVGGYVYQQLTGDSGAGATEGSFIGQVASIGPMVEYTIAIGGQTLALAGRWYHEFYARNRTRGDAVFASLAFPL